MTDVSFSSQEHDKFLTKTKKGWNAHQDHKKSEVEASLLGLSLLPKPIDKRSIGDLRGLVPPLKVNLAQEALLKFLFSGKDAKTIIDNREQIYYGLLNDKCPNFDDPDATVPYINFATQKLECRRPMPNRKPIGGVVPDCRKEALNGPNPFATELYIKETGDATCRMPVVRGKFFCNENNTGSKDYHGTHMTLPDGTGICVPPIDAAAGNMINVFKSDEKPRILPEIYVRFPSDRIIHAPKLSQVADSPYYNLFAKNRFNYGMVDLAHKAYVLGAENGKHKVLEYLNAYNDPLHGVFQQVITALHNDPLPDAVKRYHRDLYFYMKEYYPSYFKNNSIPNEDRMRFLGYEGSWLFDNSNVREE